MATRETVRGSRITPDGETIINHRADLVLADPATVRRIRLHHVLVRRRRWAKALDRLIGRPDRPYDPWADPVFLAEHAVACDLAGVGRG